MTKDTTIRNLGFLGSEYQWKLTKIFIEEPEFFIDMVPIINQNAFTETQLKKIVNALKNYYEKYGAVCSYEQLAIELNSGILGDDNIEALFTDQSIQKLKATSTEGYESNKEKAALFFKQQALVKAMQQCNEIIKNGNFERYTECAEILQKALNAGNREDIGERLFDNVGEVLAEDYREVIPTGIAALDERLEGGVGKGEICLIICGSGSGKTSMTTGISQYNVQRGRKVVQIVFEDRLKVIKRKHIAYLTEIETKDLGKKEAQPAIESLMQDENIKSIANQNLILKRFADGEKRPSDIKEYLKKLINMGFKPDAVVIDYFDCLKIKKASGDNKLEAEEETMIDLLNMAEELNIALILPTQGTRDSITPDIIGMDKVGGSWAKVKKSHIVLTISRSEDDIVNNKANITIGKNRAGKIITLKDIYFNNGTCHVESDREIVIENNPEVEQQTQYAVTNQLQEFLELEAKKRELASKENPLDVIF